MSRFNEVSKDPNVFIYTGPWIRVFSRALILLTITLLLLVPVILCNMIENLSVRITIYILCTVIYLLVLALLTKSHTLELLLAGVT
ncbi:hypothetical protein VTJ04DRAFT_4247 [Mycothermus thermophilus]|uniref:uncharacterized protein n=1 Tax=Humicola insolens TaxID=85995 RepID=UPI0037420493